MDRNQTDSREKLAELHTPKGDDFLTLDELKALTPQMVIERTRALKQPLRDHAALAEKLRRPVDHLWDELRRTGYFYLLIPKKYGGLEASIDEVIDATLPLAEGCGATAWVASFGLMHNRHMADYSEQFQDEIWKGGRFIIEASGTMPLGHAVKVEGGYRINGRFKWATCITQADWVQPIVNIETPDGPVLGAAMVPIGDVAVIDTWDTDGMRATGTHDFECKDVFVPEHRMNTERARDGNGRGSRLYDNPIYRVPLSPLLAFTVLISIVGVAKSAIELYRERLEQHTKRGTDARTADKQASQIRLAKADTMVTTAEMLMRSSMKENLKGTDLVGDAQIPFRSRLRAQMSYAATLCREAVVMVCEATGTSIHYLDNPMQRILRDIMVGTSHIVFDNDVVMEQHGRGMLGLPANSLIV